MIEGFDSDPKFAALRDLGLMGTPPEERFDRITRLARDLFGVPIAQINFLDEKTHFIKSPQVPGVATERPREGTFCDATLLKGATLVIPDLEADAEFGQHTNVAGAPHLRFYAGRPLTLDEGQQIGTICLLDVVPRELSAPQSTLLDEFGSWVELELRDTAARDHAEELQQKLLPAAAVHPDGYHLAGMSIPLHQLAGDFFNWGIHDHAIDLTVVDVMGKGAGAAILAAGVRAAVGARVSLPPVRVVSEVNAQLSADFAATASFATLLHGRLDTATGILEFVDGGHGLSVIIRAGGGVERLASVGLPIGIADDGGWLRQTVELGHGDMLVSFTDGLLDLYDGTLESVDPFVDLARASGGPVKLFEAIRALARQERARDDITVLVVTRE